jgi:DNA repair protein RadC
VLSIIIGTGIKGKPAEKIAEEILTKFGSYKGMSNQPLEKFLKIKGLGDVKIIRIAAAFEIAKRCVDTVIKELKEDQSF